MRKLFNQTQEQDIIAQYGTGLSTIKLAEAYNCSPGAINNVLKRNNIQCKSNKEYRTKYHLNHDFFETIDTEEKAYWLGFLYADGNVRKHGNQSVIQFKVNDKEVLEKFVKSINCDMPIGEYTRKDGDIYYGVHLTSDKMFEDLCNQGCVPNKSLILKFPTKIPENLIHHFIRGYFDGDGCVYINNKKWIKTPKTNPTICYYEKLGIVFNGTNEFLTELNKYFNVGKVSKENRRKNTNTWYIMSTDQKLVKEFYNYIYKDATVWLSRKKEKFENYFKERCSETIIDQLSDEEISELKE